MNSKFKQLRLSQLDRSLAAAKSLPPRPSGGWLASVREALGLSLAELGGRVHAPRQNIQQFERAEAADKITLSNLRRVAGAMGCDVVYVLVPKSGSLSEIAEGGIRDGAARDVKRVMQTMALEDQKPGNGEQFIKNETQRRLKR